MITIFTDGSSRGNPGPGGWGAIMQTPDRVIEMGGYSEKTTNNIMEMTAALEALKSAKKLMSEDPHLATSEITINTDSEYLVKGITQWIHGWKKKGWITAAKKPVLNKEIWQALDEVVDGLSINWNAIRGHMGIPGNERADEIATTFADEVPTDLYNDESSEYTVDLSTVSAT